MIAYFDTSAIIPLLVQEPGTEPAGRLWHAADRAVTVRLTRVEAGAALARAGRMSRVTTGQLQRARTGLDDLFAQLDLVEIDDELTERAADLAEAHALKAYGAVHLAAALRLGADDTIVCAGDNALLDAAGAYQLAVAKIS